MLGASEMNRARAIAGFSRMSLAGTAWLLAAMPAATAQDSAISLPTTTVTADRPGQATGRVEGYVAPSSTTSTKTDTPILEIPQTINVVTSDQIRDQGAQSVSEVLYYTPGVFARPQGESSRYDEIRIRGFAAKLYLDGLRLPFNQFWATPSIDPYALERVEILKGPSSALYGQNAPGGLIDMISKRPVAESFQEFALQTGSFERLQGAFDLGGAIDEDKRLLFRLTGLLRDANTEVDFTEDKRGFIAPALTWRPTADTSLTFLGHYGRDLGDYPHQYLPAQGTLLYNPHGRIPRNRFVGEPDFSDFERTQYWLGYAFEHRFNDVWSVRQNLRFSHVDVSFNTLREEGLQADLRTLDRFAFSQQTDADLFTVDNQAQANFVTGPFQHKVLLGLDYQHQTGDLNFRAALASTLDIYNPAYGSPIPPLGPYQSNHQTLSQLGIYAQDQIKFGRWILTLGGRYDWAEIVTDDHLASLKTVQNDTAFTGRAGLTYLFDNGVAPYIAYGTSFEPQFGTDIFGTPFKPATGGQFEAGIKYQPPGTKTLLTFAAFDLTQESFVTFGPSGFGEPNGTVHVRGFEAEAKASLTDNLDVIASYAYLDSEVTESAEPNEIGRPFLLTPKHQAAAWAYYTFKDGPFDGLSLGAGVRYVGSNYSETASADPVLVPSFYLFDAALRYDLGKWNRALEGVQLAVNATNLSDKYYVTYCWQTVYCSLGAGRTVMVSLTYRR